MLIFHQTTPLKLNFSALDKERKSLSKPYHEQNNDFLRVQLRGKSLKKTS